MSTNKTENLNLHSWVPTDEVRMSEFNENFSLLDAAIGDGVPRVAAGTYAGNGASGARANPQQVVGTGFTPKAVIVGRGGILAEGALVATGGTVKSAVNSLYTVLQITDGGFIAGSYFNASSDPTTPDLNHSGYTYHYLAIG